MEDDLVLEDQTLAPGSKKTSNAGDTSPALIVLETPETVKKLPNLPKTESTSAKPSEELIEILKDEEDKENNQPCQDVSGCQQDVLEAEIDTPSSKDAKSPLPPQPPKRSSQTNQRLKKLSRMIKYTIPSKMTMIHGLPKTSSKSSKVERKSLKDKMMDNDFTTFLKERRAVSESRFKTLDHKSRSPSPGITRTRSDQELSDAENKSELGVLGISPGNINNLVEKFERQTSPIRDSKSPSARSLKSPSRDLKSPVLVKEVLNVSSSPSRNTNIKTLQDNTDKHSTTSPESGMDESNRSETESKKSSKKSSSSKKDKSKENRRRHSGCEACNSDRESKKSKKKSSSHKKHKKVTIHSDSESKKKAKKDPVIQNGGLDHEVDSNPLYAKVDRKSKLAEEFVSRTIQRSSREPTKTRPNSTSIVNRLVQSFRIRSVLTRF